MDMLTSLCAAPAAEEVEERAEGGEAEQDGTAADDARDERRARQGVPPDSEHGRSMVFFTLGQLVRWSKVTVVSVCADRRVPRLVVHCGEQGQMELGRCGAKHP